MNIQAIVPIVEGDGIRVARANASHPDIRGTGMFVFDAGSQQVSATLDSVLMDDDDDRAVLETMVGLGALYAEEGVRISQPGFDSLMVRIGGLANYALIVNQGWATQPIHWCLLSGQTGASYSMGKAVFAAIEELRSVNA